VLQYLHEYIIENPGIFEKAVGSLPDGAFRESNASNKRRSSSNRSIASKRKSTDNKNLEELKQFNREFNQDQAKRTKSIEIEKLTKASATLRKEVGAFEERYTAGIESLKAVYTPQTLRQKWEAHRTRKAARMDAGEDDIDDFTPEAQALLMDRVDFAKIAIRSAKQQLQNKQERLQKLDKEDN
jgi:hypothetical protein